MHSDDKFWSIFWMVIGATLLGMTLTIAGCSIKETQIEADMLASGKVDPMQVRCAQITADTNQAVVLLCSEYIKDIKK